VEDIRIDAERFARTGIAEAVYAPGKTVQQVLQACDVLLKRSKGAVIATRVDEVQREALVAQFPDAEVNIPGRLVVMRAEAPETLLGTVAIVTAGTSDLPVAHEAAAVASAMGAKCDLLADRGVAGLHRTIEAAGQLTTADVVIAVAGMEGALPSVLAGLIQAPIVAVPTSVGYGSSMEGITALLAMMSACAPGVAVVGIDNGFGAAVHAIKILRGRE
jgi:pyridinium-3,5-biscarboxylic acid mononucleotide synthase